MKTIKIFLVFIRKSIGAWIEWLKICKVINRWDKKHPLIKIHDVTKIEEPYWRLERRKTRKNQTV